MLWYHNVQIQIFSFECRAKEVTSRKQYPECFVRVMNLPNLPAGRALFDQISAHFLRQIEGPQ